jgi:DNA-damage-inducible protein J
MGQTNMSIRVDEDIKREAEILFAKLGLTISAATNVFYRQAVRTQGIPFPLTAVEVDNKMQARKEFGELVRSIQEDSVRNGTDKMTMDEIDGIIAEVRASQ